MNEFELGDSVKCVSINYLKGKLIAPPLELAQDYEVMAIFLDKRGNQHLDVGLKSVYHYISSFETGEHLPKGDQMHWCHPSRFKKNEK